MAATATVTSPPRYCRAAVPNAVGHQLAGQQHYQVTAGVRLAEYRGHERAGQSLLADRTLASTLPEFARLIGVADQFRCESVVVLAHGLQGR